MSLFCLIHGSTQGPGGWDLLVRELAKRGHRSVCVDLPVNEPEASATRYADAIAHALRGRREIPVLVAHSASGLFLPLFPERTRVERLVFLAAVIPRIGKSLRELAQAHPEMFRPEWRGKDPARYKELARHFLFHDCEPEAAEWAMGTLRLMYARQAIVEICPLERWPDTLACYILCAEDRTLDPDWWRAAACEWLGAAPLEISAGHAPHVSRPAELADMLSSLAAAETRG